MKAEAFRVTRVKGWEPPSYLKAVQTTCMGSTECKFLHEMRYEYGQRI